MCLESANLLLDTHRGSLVGISQLERDENHVVDHQREMRIRAQWMKERVSYDKKVNVNSGGDESI